MPIVSHCSYTFRSYCYCCCNFFWIALFDISHITLTRTHTIIISYAKDYIHSFRTQIEFTFSTISTKDSHEIAISHSLNEHSLTDSRINWFFLHSDTRNVNESTGIIHFVNMNAKRYKALLFDFRGSTVRHFLPRNLFAIFDTFHKSLLFMHLFWWFMHNIFKSNAMRLQAPPHKYTKSTKRHIF